MITIYLRGRLAFGGRGSFYPSNTIDGTLPNHVLKCFPLLQKPFRSKSDQHQFSPNNISRSTRVKVMRITIKIDDQRESTLISNQILKTILKRNVWRAVWRVSMWILITYH